MLVLKMSEDRNLMITKRGNSYQDENNAENIKIILPKILNEIDLKNCDVYLCFANQNGVGDTIKITDGLVDYKENHYVTYVPILQTFTYMPGTIQMWVKILYTPSKMNAKSNEVTYTIKAHRDVEGNMPEHQMSIIDDLVTKMDETSGKVDEIDDYVSELQKGVVLLAHPSEGGNNG